MSFKKVIIIGATGTIGQHIINAFIARKEHFEIIAALTTKTSRITKSNRWDILETQNVKVIAVDEFNEKELEIAFKGFDLVISAVGYQLISDQKLFADIAVKSGIKRFYPSAFSFTSQYSESKSSSAIQEKIQIMEYLKQLCEKYPSFSYTQFDTGIFTEYIAQGYVVGADTISHTMDIVDGNIEYSTTTLLDIGKYLVASVLKPETSKNCIIEVQSAILTFNETLNLFEKIQGVLYKINNITLDDIKKSKEINLIKNNQMGVFLDDLKYYFLAGFAKNVSNDENQYSDITPESIEKVLQASLPK